MTVTMSNISSTAVRDDEFADPTDLAQPVKLAELFEALGDPTRLRIRSERDTACVPSIPSHGRRPR